MTVVGSVVPMSVAIPVAIMGIVPHDHRRAVYRCYPIVRGIIDGRGIGYNRGRNADGNTDRHRSAGPTVLRKNTCRETQKGNHYK
jgi:hypothetical protein